MIGNLCGCYKQGRCFFYPFQRCCFGGHSSQNTGLFRTVIPKMHPNEPKCIRNPSKLDPCAIRYIHFERHFCSIVCQSQVRLGGSFGGQSQKGSLLSAVGKRNKMNQGLGFEMAFCALTVESLFLVID